VDPVSGMVARMLAGLKSIRRRLRAPTDEEVNDVIESESQDADSVDDLRARQRLEDLRNRLRKPGPEERECDGPSGQPSRLDSLARACAQPKAVRAGKAC